jgi:hypothetical protein
MQFNTKSFDTNTNYDTTLYRFTPTVAGYYQINGTLAYQGSTAYSSQFIATYIYKNGVSYLVVASAICPFASVLSSGLIYCNGSTDYIEIYCQQQSGVSLNVTGINFSGSLVRSA